MIGSHSFLANPIFEIAVILATLVFVYVSIWRPYMKDRTQRVPFYLSLLGLLLILMHHMIATYGTVVIVLGGVLVASAHIYSLISASHQHNNQ